MGGRQCGAKGSPRGGVARGKKARQRRFKRRRRRSGVRGWVVAEAGVECSGPGEAPEVEAEPVRSLDGPRCGGAAESRRRRSSAPAQSTAALVGFEGGAADGILGSRAV